MAETLTIAGHIAAGQRILHRLVNANISPSTPMYSSLAQESIAHTLTAIALILDGQEQQAIPGLPKGYEITTRQTGNGNRKWRYELTGPQMAFTSRYRYDTSETALIAGIRHAQDDATVPGSPVHLVPDQATASACGCGTDRIDTAHDNGTES